MEKCLICNKELEGRQIKFCSNKCCSLSNYKNNKKRYIENARRWFENNKEKGRKYRRKALNKYLEKNRDKFNEMMKGYYKKNKYKWDSRARTYQLLRNKKKKIIMEKKCKLCGSNKYLKLKFEEYPRYAEEIRKAIQDKKIYYICQECRLK